MAKDFWFSFIATDYLNDPDVDRLPLDAQAILTRMWCVCCIEGSIPNDTEEIARKCKVRAEMVRTHMPALVRFFYESSCGILKSHRLDREMKRQGDRSRAGAVAAQARWKKARNANASAKRHAKPPANKPAILMGLQTSISTPPNTQPTQVEGESRIPTVEKVGEELNSVYGKAVNANASAKVDAPSDATPEGLHQNQYATRLLEDIGLPTVRQNIEYVAAAIVAHSKQASITKAAAFEFIKARALDAQQAGEPVTQFWFSDGKYRPAVQAGRKLSRKEALDEALVRAEREELAQ